MEEVVEKGGINWLDFSLRRRSGGVELRFRADPKLEEFMASLHETSPENLVNYGRTWRPIGSDVIMVRPIEKQLQGISGYRFQDVCGNLVAGRPTPLNPEGAGINLSWLQFVGISDGLSFLIDGPFQRSYIKDVLPQLIGSGVKKFIGDFITEVGMNVRITGIPKW
jgi:hypothetical protein